MTFLTGGGDLNGPSSGGSDERFDAAHENERSFIRLPRRCLCMTR